MGFQTIYNIGSHHSQNREESSESRGRINRKKDNQGSKFDMKPEQIG